MKKLFIAQEREELSILLGLSIFDSATSNVEQIIGADFNIIYLGYNNGRTAIVGDEEAFEKLEKTGISLVKKNPELVKEFIQKFKAEAQKFNSITKKIFDTDLTKISNQELLNMYKEYYDQYYKLFPYGEPITWALRFGFVKELEKEISKKIKDKRKINEYVATLITPKEPSFVNKEEQALLKIIMEIKKEQRFINLFKEPLSVINQKLVINFPKLNAKIDEHTSKYCWTPYDNGSILWDKNYFIEIIKDHIEKNIDVEKKIEIIQTYSSRVIAKKKKIITELKLGKHISDLFEAIADAGYLLDLKKEKTSYSHYHMIKWFKETANRLNISIKQLEYMLPEELEKALLYSDVDKKILDERQNYCIIKIDKGKISCYYKDEAKKIFSRFETTISNKKTEIQGTCAHPGTIRGVARIIISAKDVNKLQKGEILITSMTTPDYISAMKKATGIVTNEGGITSHAAIISRELGIPCIVGTKIATRFFKNGDFIELHESNGVVRKIG